MIKEEEERKLEEKIKDAESMIDKKDGMIMDLENVIGKENTIIETTQKIISLAFPEYPPDPLT